MALTSSSSTSQASSHLPSLPPQRFYHTSPPSLSDDSCGKPTPIRTPSRSFSSRANSTELDDRVAVTTVRKPPQAHREGDTKPSGPYDFASRRTDHCDTDDEYDEYDRAEDDALVLEDPVAGMSSWAGQPSIRGSSEAMRMVLLTFNTLGITYAKSLRALLGLWY